MQNTIEQAQLDFDAPMPSAAHEDAPGEAAGTFAVGDSVYLRGARFGEPGTVLRVERRKVVVLWHDLDYLARHNPAHLIEAEPQREGNECESEAV